MPKHDDDNDDASIIMAFVALPLSCDILLFVKLDIEVTVILLEFVSLFIIYLNELFN